MSAAEQSVDATEGEVFSWNDGYTRIYTGPRYQPTPYEPDLTKCRGECADTRYFRITHWYSCARKPKVYRSVKMRDGTIERVGFCGTHDPANRRAKAEAKRAKWKAESAERQRQIREHEQANEHVTNSRAAYIDALKQIRDGHNDPRALAGETLVQWGES